MLNSSVSNLLPTKRPSGLFIYFKIKNITMFKIKKHIKRIKDFVSNIDEDKVEAVSIEFQYAVKKQFNKAKDTIKKYTK